MDNHSKQKLNRADRLNVVICAFACSPYHGSEEGVGWNVVSRMGDHHNVTVLYGDCGDDNRRKTEIERWIAENGEIPGVSFIFVSPSAAGKFLLRLAHYGKRIFPPLVFLYYYSYRSWLQQACKTARRLHKHRPFDIAHQLTYISYREPGYLWNIPIPFVWGPIAGAVNVPWRFFTYFSIAGILRLAFRNAANIVQRKGSRYVRKAARRSSKIWVVGSEELKMVTHSWGVDAELMPETGTTLRVQDMNPAGCSCPGKLTLLWSGTHESGKALPILLHALATLKDSSHIKVIILGDGPERPRWCKLATDLGISRILEWKGHLSHNDAKASMEHADAFVFTSLKEATSTVIMEAIACGLPVICHDACGMAEAIDETCGVKIPVVSPRDSVTGFHDAIQLLLDKPSLLRALSFGAQARAISLSWDNKVKRIADTYTCITSKANQN